MILKNANLDVFKLYYTKINSFEDIKVGNVVLIQESGNISDKNKSPNELKKGIVVQKLNKKFFFQKDKCIIFNVNSATYPEYSSVKRILDYFNDNKEIILNDSFEFEKKYSIGEAVFLVTNPNNIYKIEGEI